MIDILFNWITEFISLIGYFGIFILMIMESMIFPVPSEAVMPFAGYLATTGRFDLLLVTFIATIGTIIGSLISYYIGLQGIHLIKKYHWFFLLDEHHLEITNKFFNKYGAKTVFVARFIPIIRHLISLPAGMGRMNLRKFILYTFFGGFIWNFILAYLGFRLGKKWVIISSYSRPIDIVILIFGALFLFYLVFNKIKKNSFEKRAGHQ